jgi:hypothetical protein
MDTLRCTERETRLATERRRKFQGIAKVDLEQIHFDTRSHEVDQKMSIDCVKIFVRKNAEKEDKSEKY